MQAHLSNHHDPDNDASQAPLARLAALQRAVGAGADRLIEIVSRPPGDTETPARAAAIRVLFDELAPKLIAVEEQCVHPALIESMPGSDPVCLREMTGMLAGEQRALQRRWHALRPAVELLGEGHHAAGCEADALREFATAWRTHLAHEQSELLPMAERLLDDAALDAIGRALDDIRGA